jgi:ABC-2 type transport system permease protein
MYCQGLGLLAVRAPVLGFGVVLSALAFTRELPDPSSFVWVCLFGLAAMALIIAWYLLLGLTAFWLDDVAPLYWIWQKALFLLGGLMLPLELYPAWIRALGALTPFPSLLSGPASALTTDMTVPSGLALAVRQAGWSLAVVALAALLFTHVTRRMQIKGG